MADDEVAEDLMGGELLVGEDLVAVVEDVDDSEQSDH